MVCQHPRDLNEDKLSMIEFLVTEWEKDLGRGYGAAIFADHSDINCLIPGTAIMAPWQLGWLHASATVSEDEVANIHSRLCSSLVRLLQLRTGGDLRDRTVFMLRRAHGHIYHPYPLSLLTGDTEDDVEIVFDYPSLTPSSRDCPDNSSDDWSWSGNPADAIAIEANIAYVLGLHQVLLFNNGWVKAAQALAEEWKKHSINGHSQCEICKP